MVVFFGLVILVLVGVVILSRVNEGEKETEVKAGMAFMHGKISSASPSQSFKAALGSDELGRHSGTFRVGADYEAFRVAQQLWHEVRTAPQGDASRAQIEAFYTEAQDQLKQDLLSNQVTAAALGDMVGESNLWDKLNRDPQ